MFTRAWHLQTPWPEPARELYRPRDFRLSVTLVPMFADRGCHVVCVTDPYGRILGFLDRTSLTLARLIYSTTHHVLLTSILELSWHICLGFHSGVFPWGFSYQNFVFTSPLFHACYIPCQSYPSWFDDHFNICEEYVLWNSSLCSFHRPRIISFSIGPNALLNTLSLCFPLYESHSSTPIQNCKQNYSFVYRNLRSTVSVV
jgi:hypothetical protein